MQHDIKRMTAKISASSSGNIDKYECLTGEKILHPKQNRIIQEAKFTFSPLEKALEKQVKTIEDNWKEQLKASQSLDLNNHQIQPYQLLSFKPLSYCFEETIGFDVMASFARRPVLRLIKSGDITKCLIKGYSVPRDFSWIQNYKLISTTNKIDRGYISKRSIKSRSLNELKKLLEIEQKVNREDLLYKTGNTKKDRVYA